MSNIATNHSTRVSGILRISAPPAISDSLLAPLIIRFQEAYHVRVQVFTTDRILPQIAEGIDLAFRVGELEDSSLVVSHLLTYRHQSVASPSYLKNRKLPKRPAELAYFFFLDSAEYLVLHARRWEGKSFDHFSTPPVDQRIRRLGDCTRCGRWNRRTSAYCPTGLAASGGLVEVMPHWHLRFFNLSLVHLGNRYIPRAVRVLKDFAVDVVRSNLPKLRPPRLQALCQ
jgi:DNA-binding transcriptional LysR family regulator